MSARGAKRPSGLFREHGSNLARAGLVTREAGGELQATAIEDGQVVAIHIVHNPDKLGHLD
ncbi:hypothetical protein [Ensifer sp. 4252]|uniref:hypothetical protein n=1 Tax=Ensifer sp. 4252 TaxID=3373915 RepID=UPI003D22A472